MYSAGATACTEEYMESEKKIQGRKEYESKETNISPKEADESKRTRLEHMERSKGRRQFHDVDQQEIRKKKNYLQVNRYNW